MGPEERLLRAIFRCNLCGKHCEDLENGICCNCRYTLLHLVEILNFIKGE